MLIYLTGGKVVKRISHNDYPPHIFLTFSVNLTYRLTSVGEIYSTLISAEFMQIFIGFKFLDEDEDLNIVC